MKVEKEGMATWDTDEETRRVFLGRIRELETQQARTRASAVAASQERVEMRNRYEALLKEKELVEDFATRLEKKNIDLENRNEQIEKELEIAKNAIDKFPNGEVTCHGLTIKEAGEMKKEVLRQKKEIEELKKEMEAEHIGRP